MWVIIMILIQKKVKEQGSQTVMCLLMYLHNELVNKVKLVALCICLGMMLDNANKTNVKEDSEEVKEEKTNREIQEVN